MAGFQVTPYGRFWVTPKEVGEAANFRVADRSEHTLVSGQVPLQIWEALA